MLFQLNQGKGVYTSRRNDIVHCIIIKYGEIILLQQAKIFHFAVPNVIIQVGSWICMIVFSIRVIGEFNYFGIFKRQKGTHFARMDTGLYIPLCAFYLYLSY